jgi:hypothetical protein
MEYRLSYTPQADSKRGNFISIPLHLLPTVNLPNVVSSMNTCHYSHLTTRFTRGQDTGLLIGCGIAL